MPLAAMLDGPPAVPLQQWAVYRPQSIGGVSLVVAAPLGDYDRWKLDGARTSVSGTFDTGGMSYPYPWFNY